jgi:hypothetical protein
VPTLSFGHILDVCFSNSSSKASTVKDQWEKAATEAKERPSRCDVFDRNDQEQTYEGAGESNQ